MSNLMKCPTCGNNVSPNAPTCPRCGEIINKKMTPYTGKINLKDPVHLIGVIFAILAIFLIVVRIIGTIITNMTNY